MMTSGSCRRTCRSASWKESVSVPTSRWLIRSALVAVEELDRVLDRDDVDRPALVDVRSIAASVVDLPLP
jgi:hypothetical protein